MIVETLAEYREDGLSRRSRAPRGTDDYQVPRYSRAAGIGSYRRRRRRNTAFKVFVCLLLAGIIGGAALLFGRAYLDYGNLPFNIPEVPNQSSENGEEGSTRKLYAAQMTMASAGDVIMNQPVVESGLRDSGAYNFDHLFVNISHELVNFNLRTVSEETAMAGSIYGFGQDFPLNAPQELGRAEVASGFNVILHATDHTLDTGYEGVHNELAWWHSELPNTPVIGIAEPDPISNPGLSNYVDNVFTVDKDGFRIAILNHTVGVVDTDRSVVSALDEAKVRADVEKARSLGAEMVVVCPHWGHEGVPEVTEEQRKFARLYADLGVDVICGTNPRTLQPVEVLYGSDNHKTVCFYSLGCLVSSLNHENFLGGIAEYTLERMDGGRCRVRSAVLKPVVTRRAEREAYTIYFLSDYSDELAAIGWDNVSKETFQQMCTDILGSGYDRATCTYKVDLGIPEDAAPQQEAPAEQAPAEEAPAEPAPAEQAPAPAEEVPAEEAPVEEAA